MSKLKNIIFKLSAITIRPFTPYVVPNSVNAISIFIFHGVYKNDTRKLTCNSSKSQQELTTGLQALKAEYPIISIDEAVELLSGRAPLTRNYVLLSFDDSLKCGVEYGLPILKDLGLPAIFYLSTDVIDNQGTYWWHRLEYSVFHAAKDSFSVNAAGLNFGFRRGQSDLLDVKRALKKQTQNDVEEFIACLEDASGTKLTNPAKQYPCAAPMTWQDAKELESNGIDVGNHTASHPNLGILNHEEALEEYERSQRSFAKHLGKPCSHLSYPFGFWNEHSVSAAKQAGFVSAVTCETPGWNSDSSNLLLLNRFAMHFDSWKAPYQVSGQHNTIAELRSKLSFRT